MQHYLSYRRVLRKRFGSPVLKLPLNGGFSCPNRDGTQSSTGCLFCDNRSFSPVAKVTAETAVHQLHSFVKRRRSDDTRPLIPYLQPFSNTYGTVAQLRKVYEPLLEVPGVVGLAIGTRPDCFSEEIYAYLADLSRRTFLSIELGLQSSHDVTLCACNRGHTWDDFAVVVQRLSSYGIETVAHVMLGLPGETKEMTGCTAQRLSALPCSGVKIHQLMIVEGTEFARQFHEGALSVLTVEEYAVLLCDFLTRLRPDQHIHRIVADATYENGLVAPAWSADKTAALREIQGYMDATGVQQGSSYGASGAV